MRSTIGGSIVEFGAREFVAENVCRWESEKLTHDGFFARRAHALRAMSALRNSCTGSRVATSSDTEWSIEFPARDVHQRVVDIVATEMGVAVG